MVFAVPQLVGFWNIDRYPPHNTASSFDNCSNFTFNKKSYIILEGYNSPRDNIVSRMSSSQECCKNKGVSKLCLGLCEKENGRPEYLSRNLRCTAYQNQIEECTIVKPANIGV